MNAVHTKKWFVIKTMSRAEKKTAERIDLLGFTSYLPLQTTIKQWSDRKRKVKLPLIPGIVFVSCNEAELISLYEVQGVYSILKFLNNYAVVREEEIRNLQLLLKEQVEISEEEFEEIIEGEIIEVTQGPLIGIIATSIEHQRNYRLIIQFESIGRQFVVHVSRSQVRKIKDKIA
ncbi:MAG: UpxY family transcription antiterminator [Crocinitomicaceae bacterium]|tara:strand:- start:110 stop:634 length:525 start_codon:yes stop_codon:yes gene_type:complete